jgi:leucyl aminopeptidase
MFVVVANSSFLLKKTSTFRNLRFINLTRVNKFRKMSSVPGHIGSPATAGIYSTQKWLPNAPVNPRMTGIAKVTTVDVTPTGVTSIKILSKADALSAIITATGCTTEDAERENVVVIYESGKRSIIASLGTSLDKVDINGLRKTIGSAVSKLKTLKAKEASFIVPAIDGVPLSKVAEVITHSATLHNYSFDKYLTGDKVPTLLESIYISFEAVLSSSPDVVVAKEAARVQSILSESVIFCRDLGNDRADEVHPEKLEEVARAIAKEMGADIHIVKGQDLVDQGLHLLAAVGQCARYPPRYIEIFHKGDPEHAEDVIMVLGKGITYDTGGLNIKGTGFMENMHMDMCGSAASLSSALACYRLGVKRNIVFVVAVAENAIGSLAYKPKSIIKSHKGLTVEIGNTDAEGRLVLADALSLCQQRHKPHTIIDMATLTGACIIALGEYAAGLFTNNASLSAALVKAGEKRGERLHPMPIFPEHREEIKSSSMSDLVSTGAGRYGGACTAAAFLENFIGGTPVKNSRIVTSGEEVVEVNKTPAWAHIDLAGPAMYSKTRGFMPEGSTGFAVQTIYEYVNTAPAGALADDEKKRF